MSPPHDAPLVALDLATADPEAAALYAQARDFLPWMQAIRRDFHQHPELGLEEHRTNARIQDHLKELEIDYVSGLAVTGIVATLPGLDGSRAVALRGDIDALPLQDGKNVPYRSQIPGRMHACGHDVHTTVLLGAARLLKERSSLPGTVKLLFQPAEETVGGAKMLVEEGALDDPPVDAIFGLHVDAGIDVGQVGLRYGQRNASSDNLAITIHGRSGHGAYPSGSVDAIVAAAHVVAALQSVVSRNIDARHASVVTIGTIQGGTQRNIVCNRVELVGTVRCLDQRTREMTLQRVREVSEGVAAGLGARAEVEVEPSYDPLVNDDTAVDVVRGAAERLLGAEAIQIVPRANMGVEDFAFYLSKAPGAFYSLGVRNAAAGIIHPVHNELFDVDERCLAIGATLQALNALAILER